MRIVTAFAIALATVSVPAAAPVLAQAGGTVPAGAYEVDKSHSRLIWSLDHLGFSTYYGRFESFDVKLQLDPANPAKSSLTFTVDATSVATGNDRLTGEIKDWFEVTKFPTATFQSTSVTPGTGNTAQVAGNLTLHGVTKPITLSVKLHGAGNHPMAGVPVVGFDGTATIKRSEFGISQAVPAVSDEVNLTFSGEFRPVK